MKILSCLRCQHRSLVSTGAFWSCGRCGYAITQAALFAESGQAGKRQTPASTFGERNR
ncbi:MAG: hypothetical protein ACREJU_18965 [Nitrospiraceae bacterium]